MSRLKTRYLFNFVDFGSICSNCNVNCCKRFYAILLPEEEEEFSQNSFMVETELGCIKAIGSRNGEPCPFLDGNGRCKIYSNRPLDCRIRPVIIYYDFKTGERVVYLDLDCPAVSKGLVPREFVERVVEEFRKIHIDEEWLKKYTLAPWPNHLVEIYRFKK